MQKKKEKKFFSSLIACILGMGERIILGTWLPLTVNLVQFGLGIMELHMHENYNFVFPVKGVPHFLGPHDNCLICVVNGNRWSVFGASSKGVY